MPNIRHELVIGAPAEKIYSAITSQDGYQNGQINIVQKSYDIVLQQNKKIILY